MCFVHFKVLICFLYIGIQHGTKYKIWSLMSTSHDQYVNMTAKEGVNGPFPVNATGPTTDNSTETSSSK